MNNEKELYAWVEKYRPKNIDEVVIPQSVKKVLNGILKKEELTNLLFYGDFGCGKTTCAKAICEQLGFEYMFITGTNCGIDTIRYTFTQFASSFSFDSDKRKVIIIDEAEKMSDTFSQAFNSFIEEFSDNVAFILTTNYPAQLSGGMRSRFNDVCFDITSRDEKKDLFIEFLNRTCTILDKEGVTYDRKTVSTFIFNYFPDMRKSLNMLQKYSAENDTIDVGILIKYDELYEKLFEIIKAKKFVPMYNFIEEQELNFHKVTAYFLKNVSKIDGSSIPLLIKLINDYDYKNSFVDHKKVNLIAFLTDVMQGVKIS